MLVASASFLSGGEKIVLRFFCLLSLVFLVGCGEEPGPRTVEASGIVTLDGSPVEKAQVTFIDSNASNPAVATTDNEGRFSLKYNGQKNGAIPGDYQVQVSKTVMEAGGGDGADITLSYGLPKKYSNIGTSGLKQNIPDSGIKNIEIKLQKE
jgi:hypothetical protein